MTLRDKALKAAEEAAAKQAELQRIRNEQMAEVNRRRREVAAKKLIPLAEKVLGNDIPLQITSTEEVENPRWAILKSGDIYLTVGENYIKYNDKYVYNLAQLGELIKEHDYQVMQDMSR